MHPLHAPLPYPHIRGIRVGGPSSLAALATCCFRPRYMIWRGLCTPAAAYITGCVLPSLPVTQPQTCPAPAC
eukprot:172739-Pleurochrysis_carterae.AAC.3